MRLTRTDVHNLLHNPNISLVIGQRDYVKELLEDWVELHKENIIIKKELKIVDKLYLNTRKQNKELIQDSKDIFSLVDDEDSEIPIVIHTMKMHNRLMKRINDN